MYNVQPVDLVNAVDERNFIMGVPYQVPFVPQVPINNPQLQQAVAPLTGFVIHEIQAGAKKNAIRAQFFLVCSQQNWQNQQFNQTVAMALEVVDMKVSLEGMAFQQAIGDAAGTVVTIMATLLAKETGLLTRDQSFAQSSERTFQVAQNIKQRIMQMYAQRQGMQMHQPQVYGGMQMGGGYPPVMPGMNMGMPMMQGNINHPQMQMPSIHQGIPGGAFIPMGPSNPAPQSSFADIYTRPIVAEERDPPMRQPIEEATYMNNQRPAPLAGAFRTMPGTAVKSPEPEPVVQHTVAIPHQAASDELDKLPWEEAAPPVVTSKIDDVNRPYDRVTLDNGSLVVPAALHPELTPQLTLDRPYRRIYHVDTHALFYILPHGSSDGIMEVVQPRTEEMDYLKHELDVRQRLSVANTNAATAEAKVVPDWSLASSFKTHPLMPMAAQEFTEESLQVDEGEEEILNVTIEDRITTVASLSDAQFKAAANASEAVKEGAAFESYFDIAERVHVGEEQLDKVFNAFRKDSGYDYLHVRDLLRKVRDEDMFEIGAGRDAFVATLDRTFVDEVNRVLKQDMSLTDWSIDSYVEDIAELRSLLLSKCGDAYLQKFDETAEKTINMFFGMMMGSKHYISYRAAILWVPWTTADMRIDFNGGGMIPEDTFPELYSVAKEMLERDSAVNATRFFLFADDDNLFEIRRGLLCPDCILMNQVDE